MNKFILPHMYLFFGIILFILAEGVVPLGGFYQATSIFSIIFIVVGAIWIILLLAKMEKSNLK